MYRYYTMVYLPNELINLILSFREVNPTSLLIKKSIKDCKKKAGFVVSPYYAFALVYNHHYLRDTEYNILRKYYYEIDCQLNMKKLIDGVEITFNESLMNDFKKDAAKLDKKYDNKRRAIFYPIIGIRTPQLL